MFGPGVASFNKAKSAGNWGIGFYEPEACPTSPLSKVNFTATDTTIIITAPGLSSPTCSPGTTGFQSSITVTPSAWNFGPQAVKTTSPSQSLTIRNTGTVPTEVTDYLIKGDFDQSNDCGVLATGASCTVKVTFAPEKKGAQNGNLRIITPQDVVQVSLKGTGK
jgi:Abnormal spindle-like microcephaly-assoc'd, ASPM-SPD-2-Hydin